MPMNQPARVRLHCHKVASSPRLVVRGMFDFFLKSLKVDRALCKTRYGSFS